MKHYDDLLYTSEDGEFGDSLKDYFTDVSDDLLEGETEKEALNNGIEYIQDILGCNCLDTEYKYGKLIVFDGSKSCGILDVLSDFELYRCNEENEEETYSFPSEDVSREELEEEFKRYNCEICDEELKEGEQVELEDGRILCESCAEQALAELAEEKRQEKVSALEDLSFGAFPTVMTMDMGLEYRYFNSEGYGDCLGNIGEWPAIAIKDITPEVQYKICEKLKAKELKPEDLTDSGLSKFYKAFSYLHEDCDINEVFEDFPNLNPVISETVYCLCDLRDWEPECRFFNCEGDMIDAFDEQYNVGIQIAWDELDDDELDEMYETLVEKYEGFPITVFSLKDEEEEE